MAKDWRRASGTRRSPPISARRRSPNSVRSRRSRETRVAQATIDREPSALTSNGRGAAADRVFRYAALGAGLSILLILGGIAVSTTQKAWPAFAKAGLSYVFTDNWNPNTGDFGAL